VIPGLRELLAKQAGNSAISAQALRVWLGRNPASPFKTRDDVRTSPDLDKMLPRTAALWKATPGDPDLAKYGEYLAARNQLMINLMKVMADSNLDAIVSKSVEHQPTLIKDGTNPPYVTNKGVPTLNTFLVFVSAITVPSGFTTDNLPTGITFLGKPYSEPALIKLAYSYEQSTHHRAPPKTTAMAPDAAHVAEK
jgi:amidase